MAIMNDQNKQMVGIHDARWLRTHRSILRLCGLPDEITGSLNKWNYFLNHGNLLNLHWSIQQMSPEQAIQLITLLEPFIDNPIGYICLHERKARISLHETRKHPET